MNYVVSKNIMRKITESEKGGNGEPEILDSQLLVSGSSVL